MQNNSVNAFLDYFKLFKVLELKKIQKTGLVKIIQDKQLNRKIISVEGNISTSNYINFQTNNFPNIPFSQRYLYIQGFMDAGKSFCFQVTFSIANKIFKAVYSTLYKMPKKHMETIVHLPISIVPVKWNIAVVDLYELGLHFGFKQQEIKMIFKVNSIEIRASSKVKGVFQSDYLYSIDKIPKDMSLPLKKQESFFQKYHYFVQTTDQECLKHTNQIKQAIQRQLDSRKIAKQQVSQKLKQSKSLQNDRKATNPKNRNSLQKSKALEKQQEKQKPTNQKRKDSNNLPPISQRKKQTKNPQAKNLPKQQQIQQLQVEELQIQPPAPQPYLSLALDCLQGFSLSSGNMVAVQSYLFKPVYMPTHKPIQIMIPCDENCVKVITGYNDGSICLWDAIRHKPQFFFLTQLNEIKVILVDKNLNIILAGLDKMKRQVINIISKGSIIFRQISNFNIGEALLVSLSTFQNGIVTLGYENIRLWKINNQKSIIQGMSIYLGQTNRKVKYTSGIVFQTKQDVLIFVTDSNGFITTISIAESKMIQSIKIDSCCIDQIILLRDKERALISNQFGTIKMINLWKMQVIQQYSLNNRIKDMMQIRQSEQIILSHYNKSIGVFNLQNSVYSFNMRCHTSSVTKIIYNTILNKMVSISKDNTIRIWQYVVNHEGPFAFRMQQQYQFVIAGEQMTDLACGKQGKLQELSRVMVAGDSGKIRIINIEKYEIEEEIALQTCAAKIGMSKNGKYSLVTYNTGNSYLLDSKLTIICKYLRTQNHKKKIRHWLNGFNTISKEFFIENVEEEWLQFYSLKDPKISMFHLSHSQKHNSQIQYIGNTIFLLTEGQLKIYQRQNRMQVLNLNLSSHKQISNNICFRYPLICYCQDEKLHVKILSTHLKESIQLPEPVCQINIYHNDEKNQGMILCAGVNSYGLYVITYKLHNFSKEANQSLVSHKKEEEINDIYCDRENQQNQLEISFSNKTTVSAYVNPKQNQKNASKFQMPKQLKKLYAKQQQLYEQVKQYLFPIKQKQQNKGNNDCQQFQQQQQQEQPISSQLSVDLIYGYQLRQNVRQQNEIGSFFWLSQNNSLLLLSGYCKTIIQHFFTVPIKHKVINFPTKISSLCISNQSYQGLRYLAVCLGTIIKIYNIDEQISYIRSIDSITTIFQGNVIFQSCITNCSRYICTLSYNNINFDSKLYIHVLQLSTGSVVSSSYFSLPNPKNKYKGNQIKEARQFQMMINPYRSSLEFVVFNSQGIFYFYRVTSIFTLQMMQLEELPALCRDKISNITSACFISVGDSTFEDSVLSLGTENGSLAFIDCRSANIMIACVGVIHNPIMSISFTKGHDQEYQKLVLFSNSPALTVFNLTQGLNSILLSMEQPLEKSTTGSTRGQTKKAMTLDGEVTAVSNIQNNGQSIVITKAGSLWLLDYEDFVTVKVSSIHTGEINFAGILSNTNKQHYILSCSDDGNAKISNLSNLEQVLQIYKPRKQAKALNYSGNYTLISFNDQIYIYQKLDSSLLNDNKQMSSLGSFKLDSTVLSIQNIPTTDNYYVLTQNELLIIHLALRIPKNQGKDRSQILLKTNSVFSETSRSSILKNIDINVEIKKVTDIQNPYSIIVNEIYATYDQFAVISRPGKVTVWTRKCLKRNYNPIQELANVHELSYYLIDANNRSTVDFSYVKFLNQNQYLWGLYDEGLIQVRNFREHAIMREINTSIQRITSMNCVGEENFIFYIGDQHGMIYILNENGLLLQKVKALDCKIKGIQPWQAGSNRKILVYGSKYIASLNSLDFRR